MPTTAAYTRVQTFSSVWNDAFSFQANQASLAAIKRFSVGLYSERRFMMNELPLYKVCFSIPSSSGNFGLAGGYAGNHHYKESQLGLAYGRSLGKIDLGIQFNYLSFKALGYGNATALNFEAGALVKITEKFNAGFHVYNPTGSKIGQNDEERLPAIFSAGFGYDVSRVFFIGCRIEKTEDLPLELNAALQYFFAGRLIARLGIITAPSTIYFGTGFLWNRFRIDVTTAWHQQLGLSPGIMLIFNGPEK